MYYFGLLTYFKRVWSFKFKIGQFGLLIYFKSL